MGILRAGGLRRLVGLLEEQRGLAVVFRLGLAGWLVRSSALFFFAAGVPGGFTFTAWPRHLAVCGHVPYLFQIKDKESQTITAIDERNLPIEQVSEEERKRRIAKLRGSLSHFSAEARQLGLTDEIAEEILRGEG